MIAAMLLVLLCLIHTSPGARQVLPQVSQTGRVTEPSGSPSAKRTLDVVAPGPHNTTTVLVVLGNMPLDDATPTIDTMTRVRTAVAYHEAHPDSVLVFSGGPTAGTISEARTMYNFAKSVGVREESMLLEERARSTAENAIFSAELLIARKDLRPDTIFVVSKWDHLEWAMGLFKSKDIPGRYFANSKPLGCSVNRTDSIKQMEDYLLAHPANGMVRQRLEALRHGIQGID